MHGKTWHIALRAVTFLIVAAETALWVYVVDDALTPHGEGLAQFFANFIAIVVSVPFALMTVPAIVLVVIGRRLVVAFALAVAAVPAGFLLLWVLGH